MSDAIARLSSALEGRYRVERKIGEGGMATVYLADDLRHERKVALKVLKPELAAVVGADRFLAEIKTTANLQHPHILPLHDSGEADGFLYYVMPYIEDENLRDRLDREKQLPVDEAVRIASDVAEALHVAHEQGVIHRDIKPANVLMSRGRPLVADFGIALAVSAAGGGRLTETGMSMGTPYYMSPEQASGDREPSAGSDVYSLGCVLYEMLVGEPPHTGQSAQTVLAKILTERPRLVTDMRATVPPHVAAAVARSLERLPADRFVSAERFARALGDASFTHAVTAPTHAVPVADVPAAPARSRLGRWLPWGVAAAAVVVAGWSLRGEPEPPPVPTVRMPLSDFVVGRSSGGGWRMAISTDGATLVVGGADGLLYTKRSDDLEFRPISGTEEGRNPAISPDGDWIAFIQDRVLKKTQIVGGPVLPITDECGSPHWYSQDEMVCAGSDGAFLVSSAGGAPRRITQGFGGRPYMLPGSRALIAEGSEGLYLGNLDTGDRTLIAPGGSNGRYVPTGHILYGDRLLQSVMAVPFDLEVLEVTGSPVPVLPSVLVYSGGAVQLAVSDNGTLVHALAARGVRASGTERLTWIEVDGTRTEIPLEFQTGQVEFPRVSPDGTRIAYGDDDLDEVIVYDINTGERTRVAEGLDAAWPVWSADGTKLYVTEQLSSWHRITLDGSAPREVLATGQGGPIIHVSPDERWVVAEGLEAESGPDLLLGQLGPDSVAVQSYLRADFHEEEGVVSPDGRWLAYTASEGGEHEVYVRSFPEPGPKIQVSVEGGSSPTWAPDGSAIYYRWDDAFERREIRLGESVELGERTELPNVSGTRFDAQMRMYDLDPTRERFIFVAFTEPEPVDSDTTEVSGIGPVVVVVNWFEELRQRMGG